MLFFFIGLRSLCDLPGLVAPAVRFRMEGTMEAIKIFLVVMSCSPDGLFCRDLSDNTAFNSLDACHAERAETLREMMQTHRGRLALARCQYVLVERYQDVSRATGSCC